jgi:hypothetical protein
MFFFTFVKTLLIIVANTMLLSVNATINLGTIDVTTLTLGL